MSSQPQSSRPGPARLVPLSGQAQKELTLEEAALLMAQLSKFLQDNPGIFQPRDVEQMLVLNHQMSGRLLRNFQEANDVKPFSQSSGPR